MPYQHSHRDGLSGYSYPTSDDPASAIRRFARRWWPAGLLVGVIVLFCFW